jgi:hypothetical protein
MEKMTVATEHFDDESEHQCLVLFDRELTYEECVKAVAACKPTSVVSYPEGDLFIVSPPSNWTPEA